MYKIQLLWTELNNEVIYVQSNIINVQYKIVYNKNNVQRNININTEINVRTQTHTFYNKLLSRPIYKYSTKYNFSGITEEIYYKKQANTNNNL